MLATTVLEWRTRAPFSRSATSSGDDRLGSTTTLAREPAASALGGCELRATIPGSLPKIYDGVAVERRAQVDFEDCDPAERRVLCTARSHDLERASGDAVLARTGGSNLHAEAFALT